MRQYQRPRHRRRASGPRSRSRRRRCAPPEAAPAFDVLPYAIGLLGRFAIALGVGILVKPLLGLENIDLVFLIAVVAVAVRYGLAPSIVASIAASLCYNFFFLPPLYTFTIADPTNVAAFVFFMLVAVLISNLAARVRSQAFTARARARTTEPALCLQPQARRRRHARRFVVGHRLPNRVDA